jgi:coenzyme Q-binding protein COQ10
MASAQKTIDIKASPADCYKVIMDFANYPKFVSDLKTVKILEKKGETQKVEFTISIIKEINYTLELTGEPGKGMSWKLVKGFFKKNNGSWKLEDIGKGVTRATYSVDVDLGPLVPGKILSMLTEKNFPKMLSQFKDRIEGK